MAKTLEIKNSRDWRDSIAPHDCASIEGDFGAEKTAAQDELTKRQRVRIFRKMLHHSVYDRLNYPIRSRRLVRNSGFDRDQFRSGCYLAGWYRLYECNRWAKTGHVIILNRKEAPKC